jgi:hypothetical protein
MIKAVFKLLPVILLTLIVTCISGQPAEEKNPVKNNKPYKVLTSGRQLTIKSNKNIKHVMLWTLGGNRVVEHKEVNNLTCVVDIPVSQKNFFLMIALNDGKVYTEKIGIR